MNATVNGCSVSQAADIVTEGGVIAYPTESCFGLGCNPENHSAILRILEMKQRAADKGLIVIGSDFSQFDRLIRRVDPMALEKMRSTWPGPVTWLCPSREGIDRLLTGKFTSLGVRVTAHPVAAELCRLTSMALVSTSANIANNPPLRHLSEVTETFGDAVDAVVSGEVGTDSRPSKIIDLIGGQVVRQ